MAFFRVIELRSLFIDFCNNLVLLLALFTASALPLAIFKAGFAHAFPAGSARAKSRRFGVFETIHSLMVSVCQIEVK